MANLAQFIKSYRLPGALADRVAEQLNNQDINWNQHHWYNHSNKRRTTQSEAIEPKIATLDKVMDDFMDEIRNCLGFYCRSFCSEDVFISDITLPRFNKYKQGNSMRSHYDHVHSIFDGERRGIPVLTVLGSLSSDYEGGEFVINLLDESLIYKLEKGDLLIFPSSFMYPHEVKTVESGLRLTYVSWAF